MKGLDWIMICKITSGFSVLWYFEYNPGFWFCQEPICFLKLWNVARFIILLFPTLLPNHFVFLCRLSFWGDTAYAQFAFGDNYSHIPIEISYFNILRVLSSNIPDTNWKADRLWMQKLKVLQRKSYLSYP